VPDGLLLMSKLDGFQTLVALRGQRETQDLPVIMVTGNHGEDDIVRGFQLGADDYIVKPFNARELVVRVDRAVCNAEASAAH
jgi:DNA-binding response OmpR family regulator